MKYQSVTNNETLILKKIVEIVGTYLHLQEDEIDVNTPLIELGADSIAIVEFVREINKNYYIHIEAADLYDHSTIAKLASFVRGKVEENQEALNNLAENNLVNPLKDDISPLSDDPPIYNMQLSSAVSKPVISLSKEKLPQISLVSPYEEKKPEELLEQTSTSNEPPLVESSPPKIVLQELNRVTGTGSGNLQEIAASREETPPLSNMIGNCDIAIIGFSGRFPGAKNIDEYWENLCSGTESIGIFPLSRWSESGVSGEESADNQWFGALEEADKFDPLFFNISPKDAELMDPQQRLFLEESWKAFEHAGYSQSELSGKKCAVFVGVAQGDYNRLVYNTNHELTAQVMLGSSTAILPARVSYYFNLTGPSVAVDTACSSSLVAVHLACRSILERECEMALAGGVYIQSTPAMHEMTQNAGMLSKEGKCKTFDNSADGFVIGEGVGAVVLKPLEQAITDRDTIYGVIKSSGINQDGATNGITAPSVLSQTTLEKRVYQSANINPETITLVEAHGTGTKLGDPIEVKALTDSFVNWTDKKQFCAIGSVKTNIGHLLSAAGIAGLIKVLLCLHYKKYVPSLNYKHANENINFLATPFFVNTEFRDWAVPHNQRRRAAISAFGFSGTNCHMVLEEAPEQYPITKRQSKNPYYLIVLAAKTRTALYQKFIHLAEWIENKGTDYNLADIAYTLQNGRSPMPVRAAFIVQSIPDLLEKVYNFINTGNSTEIMISNDGAEHLRDQHLFKEFAQFLVKEIQHINKVDTRQYKEKLTVLAELYVRGYDLNWEGLYSDNSVYRIPLPQYPFERSSYWLATKSGFQKGAAMIPGSAHPMLHSNQSTLFEQLFYTYLSGEEYYIKDHVIGGNRIIPAVAYLEIMRTAGTLSFGNNDVILEDVVWERPVVVDAELTLFTSLVPEENRIRCLVGIKASDNKRIVCCSGIVRQAIKKETISEVLNVAEIRRRCSNHLTASECYERFRKLGVVLGERMQAIQELFYNDTEVLSVLCLPAKLKPNFSAYVLPPSLLDGSITSAITFLNPDEKLVRVPYSLETLEILNPLEEKCYVYIKATDLNIIDNLPLPGLSIKILAEDGRVLVRMTGLISKPLPLAIAQKNEANIDLVYFQENWKEHLLSADPIINNLGNTLVFDYDDLFWSEVINSKAPKFKLAILVKPGPKFTQIANNIYEINPANEGDYLKLFTQLSFGTGIPENIICRWAMQRGEVTLNDFSVSKPNEKIDWIVTALKGLLRIAESGEVNFLCLYPLYREVESVYYEALNGLFNTVNLERISIKCRTLGINTREVGLIRQLELISTVLIQKLNRYHLKYEDGKLFKNIFQQLNLTQESNIGQGVGFTANGVYLITGGFGGLGKLLTKRIIQQTKATVILIGRREIAANDLQVFNAVNRSGADVVYQRCDVTSFEAVKLLIETVKQRYGRINGIIHAAGVTRDAFLVNEQRDNWKQVLAPKIDGVINLDQALAEENLDFFVLFSSISAVTGNPGQSAYSFANYFLNKFAAWRETQTKIGKRSGKTVAIGWPEWENGGLKVNEAFRDYYKIKVDSRPLDDETGWNILIRGLNFEKDCFSVLQADVKKVTDLLFSVPSVAADKSNNPENREVAMVSDAEKEQVEAELRMIIAAKIKMNPEDINVRKELILFGFDSIAFTELTAELNRHFGLELTPAIFFEYPTITSLSSYFLEKYYHQFMDKIKQPKLEGDTKSELSRDKTVKFQQNIESSRENKGDFKFIPVKVKAKEPIAVIGMHGVFPGVSSLDEFWDSLVQGDCLLSEIPNDRWDWRDFYGDPSKETNKTDIIWGGFINDPFAFDAKFFEISPREAEWMDPQQRIFLETVWKAIEDSGHSVSSISNQRVGLFVGVSNYDYNMFIRKYDVAIEPFSLTGNTHSIIANRVSYLLNLKGPSEAIDTACSSSLVAIRRAVEAIRNHECDLAIAGGVNILLSPDGFIGFSKGGFLSKTGRCNTFDAAADGYVRGEGCGAILLKPLNQAIRDNDHIYAVIKGTAENHGGRGPSLTAPNISGQAEVIADAIQDAEVPVETITYIETHGTGTKLGDPAEVAGLKKAFEKFLTDKSDFQDPFCGIGTVKTNIGHLESAAGIAGVIKILLAFKHQKLPASINFSKLNPYIQIENSPFYIVTETRDWERKTDVQQRPIPRRAGVSSFGFGGSNAHLILEEYSGRISAFVSDSQEQLIILSAKDEERLRVYVQNLQTFLTKQRLTTISEAYAVRLEDIAFTLQVGRDALPARLALVVSSISELQMKLAAFLNNDLNDPAIFFGNNTESALQTEKDAAIKEALTQKNLRNLACLWVLGYRIDWNQLYSTIRPQRISLPTYPFSRTSFQISGMKPQRLEHLNYLHPLVHINTSTLSEQKFTTRLTGQEFFVKDHVIAGKRILPGAAYVEMARVAGQLSCESLIRKMKKIFWTAPIVFNQDVYEYQINVFTADDNISFEVVSKSQEDQIVIHSQGELVVDEALTNEGNQPFDINKLKCTYNKSPITGHEFYNTLRENGLDYGGSFRVIKEIYYSNEEVLAFLELPESTSKTLQDFYIHPAILDGAFQAVICLLRQSGIEDNTKYLPFGIEEFEIYESLENAKYFYAKNKETGVGLRSNRYDIKILNSTGLAIATLKGFTVRPFSAENESRVEEDPATFYYQVNWVEEDLSLKPVAAEAKNDTVLLVFDQNTLLRRVLLQNSKLPEKTVYVEADTKFEKLDTYHYKISPANEDHYKILLESLLKDQLTPDRVIHCWRNIELADDKDWFNKDIEVGFLSLVYLAKTLGIIVKEENVRIIHLYQSPETNVKLTGYSAAIHKALGGFSHSLALEMPNIRVKTLKIDAGIDGEQLKAVLDKELMLMKREPSGVVRYSDGKRLVKKIQEIPAGSRNDSPCIFKEGGVYIITGGIGGVALIISQYITRQARVKLILMGRTEPSIDKRKILQELNNSGSEVIFKKGDVSKREDVNQLYAEVKDKFGQVNGIIHAAGVTRDSLLINKKIEDINEVISVKVSGTLILDEVFGNEQLDFFTVFASTTAFSGNVGQTDYSFANDFLGYFAQAREALCKLKQRSGRSSCFYWPLWKEGGMKVNAETETWLREVVGITPLSTAAGVGAFDYGIHSEFNNIIVISGNKHQFEKWFVKRFNELLTDETVNERKPIFNGDFDLKYENCKTLLKEILARIIKIDANEIKDDVRLDEYGLNSLLVVSINQELEKNGIHIPVTKIFELQTVEKIMQYLIVNESFAFGEPRLLNVNPVKAIENLSGVRSGRSLNKQGPKLGSELKSRPIKELGVESSETGIIRALQLPERIEDFVKLLQENRFDPQKNFNTLHQLPTLLLNSPKFLNVVVPGKLGQKIETVIAGTGLPLVIFSGVGTTAPLWYYQLRDLSLKHQVIIVHQPGHGNSSMVEDLSFKALSELFASVLAKLKIIQPFVLIGLSMGGMLAQTFAAEYPSLVSHLILVGTSHHIPNIPYSTLEEMLAAEFESVYGEDFYSSKHKDKTLLYQLVMESSGMPTAAFLKYVERISCNFSTQDLLSSIKAPTLVVSGERDKFFNPADSVILSREIPNAELWSIPDAGHFSPLTHYSKFNERVLNFITCNRLQ